MKPSCYFLAFFISFSIFSQSTKSDKEIKTVRILYHVEYIQNPQKYFEAQTKVYTSDYTRESVLGTFLKTKPITSILEIDNGISIYKNSDKDEADADDGTPGINMSLALGGRGLYYIDTKSGEYFNKAKNMAMIDELIYHKKKEWKVVDEEKYILGYKCKKAIHLNKYKTETVVWFTEEIPFSNGPKMLFGLNGVILEIEKKKNRVFKAKKIEINPKDIYIVKPEAELKTTAEEKEKIFKKIMEEN